MPPMPPVSIPSAAPHRHALAFAIYGAIALFAPVCAATDGEREEDVKAQADDAFGSRVGTESIGLYSESLVRGFDLQQAGK